MIKYGDRNVTITYYYIHHPFIPSFKHLYCLTKEELIKVAFKTFQKHEDALKILSSNIDKIIVEESRVFSLGTYLIINNKIPICVSNDFEKLIKALQSAKGWVEMYKILSSGLPLKLTL